MTSTILPQPVKKYEDLLKEYTVAWRFQIGKLVYKLYSYGETYESIGKLFGQNGRAIRKHYPKTKGDKYV